MICPYCGHESGFWIPTNAKDDKLADCPECGDAVYSLSSSGDANSQQANVREGEEKEEWAADRLVANTAIAEQHEDRGQLDDIDRDLYEVGDEEPVAHVEFKIRYCTLNGYRKTKFGYRKIHHGQQLIEETGNPVYIVLKFLDAWAVHAVAADRDYDIRWNEQFTPSDAADDRTASDQHPVYLPITEFSRLPFRDGCFDAEEIRRRHL